MVGVSIDDDDGEGLGWRKLSGRGARAGSAAVKARWYTLARYKGKKKWYRGVMKRNDDGTYDMLRRRGRGEGRRGQPSKPEDNPSKTSKRRDGAGGRRAGARRRPLGCEGVRGQDRHIRARKIGTGGRPVCGQTVDVTYDDGDKEEGVKAENIAGVATPGGRRRRRG